MKYRNRLLMGLLMATTTPVLAQNAADAYYDPDTMAAAREALHTGMGGQVTATAMLERFEYQSHDNDELSVWDASARIGGDTHALMVTTEGEYRLEHEETEEAEIQALYSRALTPYFDLQLGVRHDFRPDPSRNFAVIGVQGLAPQWFEVDAALFFSDDGDASARLEAEYEWFLTQRLILQPRVELNLSSDDVPELGIGSGLSTAEAGLRLRYEFHRQFAPYIGVSWHRSYGDTADFARAAGEDIEVTSLVAGVRVWF